MDDATLIISTLIIASLIMQGIPLFFIILVFELLRCKTISKLNVPQDAYKEQLKLWAPIRYMMAPLIASILCFIGTMTFLYIFFYIDSKHISSKLAFVATMGSVWPFVATTIVINKLFKMKHAFQVVNQEMPSWYFIVWPLIMTGYQFGFWIMVFYTPMKIIFMEIN